MIWHLWNTEHVKIWDLHNLVNDTAIHQVMFVHSNQTFSSPIYTRILLYTEEWHLPQLLEYLLSTLENNQYRKFFLRRLYNLSILLVKHKFILWSYSPCKKPCIFISLWFVRNQKISMQYELKKLQINEFHIIC